MTEPSSNGEEQIPGNAADKTPKENPDSRSDHKEMDLTDPSDAGVLGDKTSGKRKNGALEGPVKPNGTSKKPGAVGQKTSKQLGTSEWWEISDPNCDKPYFYSTKSHKTQWQHPLLESEPKKKKLKVTGNTPRAATNNISAPTKVKEKTSKQLGESDWWVINDPEAHRPYYYNAKTNKTQWDPPNIPEVRKEQKKPGLSEALQSIAKKRDAPSSGQDKLRSSREGRKGYQQPPQSAGKTNKRIGNTDWYVINDAANNCVYYYNAKTEKTQWEAPQVSQKRSKQIGNSEWWKIEDPDAERAYYYNTTTQKTQWSPPQIAETQKKTSKQLGDSEWWMIDDPNASKVYYYNATTQMTQWQDPRKQGKIPPKQLHKKNQKKKDSSELIEIIGDGAYKNIEGLQKCSDVCEAKTRARELAARIQKETQKREMWNKMYTEAKEQLLAFQSSDKKSESPSNPPSIDNLDRPIPNNTTIVKRELFEHIEDVPRERLLSALSTSDLRQVLSLKAELASPYTSQILYKYIFQRPVDKADEEPEHPTHSAIGSRNRKQKPMGNVDMDLPYPCFKCGLRFDNPAQILAHTRKHTFTRLFPCPKDFCNEAFAEKSSMEIHLATHGNDDQRSVSDESSTGSKNSTKSPSSKDADGDVPMAHSEAPMPNAVSAPETNDPPSFDPTSAMSGGAFSSHSSSSSSLDNSSGALQNGDHGPPAVGRSHDSRNNMEEVDVCDSVYNVHSALQISSFALNPMPHLKGIWQESQQTTQGH